MLNLNRPWYTATFWLVGYFLWFPILLFHIDKSPTVLGIYSPYYAGIIIFILAIGVSGAAFIFRARTIHHAPKWLQLARENHIFNLFMFMSSALLAYVMFLLNFNVELTVTQDWLIRGYFAVIILAVLYLVLFWRRPDLDLSWHIWLVMGLVLGIAGFVIVVHYLDSYPQFQFTDELHNWAVQWTFARLGLMGDTLFKQMIPLPQAIYDSPQYLAGFLLRIFGDGFWQARFVRLLLAAPAIPLIYVSGKRMYGRRAGLFAAALSIFLFAPSAYVRPDFAVAVLLALAIYVYLRAQESPHLWMHFLTGICIAMTIEGHPLAYRYGVAIAFLYLVRWIRTMFRTSHFFVDKRLILLGLGGFVWILLYISIHILPGTVQGLHFVENHTTLSRTLVDIAEYGAYTFSTELQLLVQTSPIEGLLIILGIFLGIYEHKRGDQLLLTMLIISQILMFATYGGYYRLIHEVHFVPIFALVAGRFLANITEAQRTFTANGRRSSFALALLISSCLVISLFQRAQADSFDPVREEVTSIGRQIMTNLAPNQVVVGNDTYFIELTTLNYYSIETVTSDHWFLVEFSGTKLWEVTNPDVFILSGSFDIPQYMDMPNLYRYMSDHGFRLAACFTHSGLIIADVYVRNLGPNWNSAHNTCSIVRF